MSSGDLCEVCWTRRATWLDNPPVGRWRQVCDFCEVIPPPGVPCQRILRSTEEQVAAWN